MKKTLLSLCIISVCGLSCTELTYTGEIGCIPECGTDEQCNNGVCEKINTEPPITGDENQPPTESGESACRDEKQLLCNNKCIDKNTDNSNCGSCGHQCDVENNETCSNASCICLENHTRCEMNGKLRCVNTQEDNTNCGSCGYTCEENNSCIDGKCIPNDDCNSHCGETEKCDGNKQCVCDEDRGFKNCNNSDESCVDLMTDGNNCGACGNRCTADENCISGACLSGLHVYNETDWLNLSPNAAGEDCAHFDNIFIHGKVKFSSGDNLSLGCNLNDTNIIGLSYDGNEAELIISDRNVLKQAIFKTMNDVEVSNLKITANYSNEETDIEKTVAGVLADSVSDTTLTDVSFYGHFTNSNGQKFGIIGNASKSHFYNIYINSNLEFNKDKIENSGCFIGEMYDSSIENANIECDISTEIANTAEKYHFGGIVGYVKSSDLKNVTYKGTITLHDNQTDWGGIAGKSQDSNLQCVKVLDLEIKRHSKSGGDKKNSNIGGFVGKLEGGSLSNANCDGNEWKSSIHSISGNDYVGGVVGYAKNTTIHKVDADVSTVEGRTNVGGFAGSSNTTFIGKSGNETDDNVCIALEIQESVKGNKNVGGFIGYVQSSSINHVCLNRNYDETSDIKPIITRFDDENTHHIGGFIGKLDGNKTSSISNVVSYWDEIDGYYAIGGFIGEVSDFLSIEHIINRVNTITVQCTYINKDTVGFGGFIGEININSPFNNTITLGYIENRLLAVQKLEKVEDSYGHIGGMIGLLNLNLGADGEFEIKNIHSNVDTITGNGPLGGFIGDINSQSDEGKFTIKVHDTIVYSRIKRVASWNINDENHNYYSNYIGAWYNTSVYSNKIISSYEDIKLMIHNSFIFRPDNDTVVERYNRYDSSEIYWNKPIIYMNAWTNSTPIIIDNAYWLNIGDSKIYSGYMEDGTFDFDWNDSKSIDNVLNNLNNNSEQALDDDIIWTKSVFNKEIEKNEDFVKITTEFPFFELPDVCGERLDWPVTPAPDASTTPIDPDEEDM